MDLCTHIEAQRANMTESEAKVAQAVLADPMAAQRFSITRLAAEAGTSTSAVQRFCQALGFAGYKEFRYTLAQQAAEQSAVPSDASQPDGQDAFAAGAARIAQAVAALAQLDRARVAQLADEIVRADRVFCVGVHRSGLPAAKLRMDLEDLGICAFAAQDVVAAAHLARLVGEESCAIGFSVAGSRSHLLSEANPAPTERVWLVTSSPRAVHSADPERVIVLPSVGAVPDQPLDEHPVTMAFVELLAAEVRARVAAGQAAAPPVTPEPKASR